MGKFSRNREYTFANIDDLVDSVIEEYGDGANIDIVLPWYEVGEILTKIISNGEFNICLLDYSLPEMEGYNYEYRISLAYSNNNGLFVEKFYNVNNEDYLFIDYCESDIIFVSDGVSKVCYDKIVNYGCNTVLFNIEEVT